MTRDAPQSSDDVAAIIGRYRSTLETLQLSPQEVRDEGELPDPKPEIVAALLTAADPASDIDLSPRQVQGWLAALAQFQPGVGTPIRDTNAETARRMAEANRLGDACDVAALARTIEDQAKTESWSTRRRRFAPLVAQDRNRLLGLL